MKRPETANRRSRIETGKSTAPSARGTNADSQFSVCNSHFSVASRRGGFTLVELMVAVTLALIVLGMFAALYHWTTETYAQQRGNRRNDQRSRMLSIVIRSDLQNRSFRYVVPFVPGQNTDPSASPPYDPVTGFGFNPADRRGYIEIAENDPDNPTDDALQFTALIPADTKHPPFFGRGAILYLTTTPLGVPPTTEPQRTQWFENYMLTNPNQPEFDDGYPHLNNLGISRAAEVVYFVRDGNLYRRTLLIREPYVGTDPQPTELDTVHNYGIGPAGGVTGVFWEDLGYSAYYKPQKNANQVDYGAKFIGIAQSLLNNGPNAVNPIGDPAYSPLFALPRELGVPFIRYGHSLNMPDARPREYVPNRQDASGNVVNQRTFIGRFLTEESATQAFLYPGAIPAAGDPHTRTDLIYNQATGRVQQYAGNISRRGEDLLMTHVHAFDIKVWDDDVDLDGDGIKEGIWIDLGHTLTTAAGAPMGFYHRSRNLRDMNLTNAQATGDWRWNRFDTWHPFLNGNISVGNPMGAAGGNHNPPYKAGGVAAGLGSTAERRLKAIQIIIRFFDVPTRKMRQVTIIQQLNVGN